MMSLLAWEEKEKPLLLAIDSGASTQEILDSIASNPSAARDEKSDNAGLLPLHAAVIKRCDVAVVKAILAANPEAIYIRHPFDSQPALHIALSPWRQISIPDQKVNEEVVLLLLAADPHAAQLFDSRGSLPIHHAMYSQCSLDLVKAILAAYPEGVKQREAAVWGGRQNFPYQIARDGSASAEVQEYVLSLYPEAGTAEAYEPDIGSFDR